MSNAKSWIPVSRSNPCRLCGKPDWCSRSKDGLTEICRRPGIEGGEVRVDASGVDYKVFRAESASQGSEGLSSLEGDDCWSDDELSGHLHPFCVVIDPSD